MAKALYAMVGVVVAGVIAYAIVSETAWYRLWRYRRDPDSVKVFMPTLCETRGSGALPAIYRAFDDHGSDADVGSFRVGVLAELRCIRRNEGTTVSQDNEKLDLADDPQLFATIVRAWNQEPDAKLRDDMAVYLSELDARAYFAIWAGIQRGPHPVDNQLFLPTVRELSPALREQWCKLVRPVIVDSLDKPDVHVDELEITERALELGYAHCTDDDIARLQRVAHDHRYDAGILGAVSGLVAMTVPPERASQTLVPLVAGDCSLAMRLYVEFEHAKLDPKAAQIIATALAKCSELCSEVDATKCVAPMVAAFTAN